jgi:DNA-directed RNA polymerase specialized sigma24 family protein
VAAYERFFRANAVRTVRLAALLGAPDPEDAAQEAFCRVFAARSRLRSIDESAVPYLNRTVVNLVRSRMGCRWSRGRTGGSSVART